MKAEDVILQLHSKIPEYTGWFSDSFTSGVTIARVSNVATVTTSVPHGLSTGDFVHISNAFSPNNLSSLTQVDGVASATTANDHDLTEGHPNGDESTVLIQDADQAEYNGNKTLLTVPNRRNFTFEVDSGAVSPATGTPKLIENVAFGYNGLKQITVLTSTTFTYTVSDTLGTPAEGSIILRKNTRISGALSIDRAIRAYTKHAPDEMWAFVVSEDATISKDRNIQSDASETYFAGNDIRQKVLAPFTVYVFVPMSDSISGREQRDQMEDLLIYLLKSLYGVVFDSGLEDTTRYIATFNGHGFFDDTNGFYIHKFDFETQYDIIIGDTIDIPANVAFRDIHIDYQGIFSDYVDNVIMTSDINLDDEPL